MVPSPPEIDPRSEEMMKLEWEELGGDRTLTAVTFI